MRRRPGPVRTALSMFTVLPVAAAPTVTAEAAAAALLVLPAVGALLGLVAGAALWLVGVTVTGELAPVLAATVAVAVLALLTGGLHLDGLADTADGLASRRPADQALALMRRSDVGPLGVAALLLTVLLQVSALATMPVGPPAAGALLVATVSGRTAVVLAAGRRVPRVRPGGFGALVAGHGEDGLRVLIAVCVAVAVAAIALAAGGPAAVRTGLIALGVGLLAGYGVRRLAQRRLGGVTGDVFGAIIEISTAAALLAAAVAGS